jgi:hypothetical protein
MLSHEDKARILEEETYRREVKAALEVADPRKASRNRLWSIVNSPVFIWLLSSVVLGIAGFLYNSWYVVEREKKHTATKLDACHGPVAFPTQGQELSPG